jgi:hypothetical protein
MKLIFMDSRGSPSGGLRVQFGSTLKYGLLWCDKKFSVANEFPIGTNLPSTKDKVWKIFLDKSSGIRLIVHCNGVEVLNVLLSSSVCTGEPDWKDFWNMETKQLYFTNADDTASDYYRNPNPGIT